MSQSEPKNQGCSDCQSTSVDRRHFLRTSAVVTLAAAAGMPRFVSGAPTKASAAESIVTAFYESLSDKQRAGICMPFDHDLRKRVNANWHVTKPLIGSDFFNKSQQDMIDQIVRKITSEDGYERLQRQMDDDDGGLEAYSVAMFGNPKEGNFQWLLTGRHLTLRADGDSVAKAAFGGPLVYGHGEETNPKDNVYYYQTQQVNQVFKALDADQAKRALLDKAPAEADVKTQGAEGKFPGLAVSEMSSDQQQLVRDTLKVILAPYREEDVAEAMQLIESGGGLGSLRFAFYKQGDLGNDGQWDIWRIEGPTAVCHFRGAPHVHAYLNISAK